MKALIYEASWWIAELKVDILKHRFSEELRCAKFKIVGFAEHRFMPFGYTACWILAESHLAIHTFPEEGRTYVQLSSCSRTHFEIFSSKLEAYAIKDEAHL